MTNGYYAAMFKEVTIECYDPPSNVTQTGSKAYKYTSTDGWESDVEITDDFEVLSSLQATGEDLKKGSPSKSSSASKSSGTHKSTFTPESIPGGTGSGAQAGGSSSSGGSGGSGGGSSDGSETSDPGEPLSTGVSVKGGFDQGLPGGGDSAGTALVPEGRLVGGSVFAVVVAILALTIV